MQTLDLSAVPYQSFTTVLDNDYYSIAIYQASNVMACDIARNNVQLVTGCRITGGSFLLPFFALEGTSGNFMVLTSNDDLPAYNQFGLTQTLIYMSFSEIAAIVA